MCFPCLTIPLLHLLQGNEYDPSGLALFSDSVPSRMKYFYTKWQVNAILILKTIIRN